MNALEFETKRKPQADQESQSGQKHTLSQELPHLIWQNGGTSSSLIAPETKSNGAKTTIEPDTKEPQRELVEMAKKGDKDALTGLYLSLIHI